MCNPKPWIRNKRAYEGLSDADHLSPLWSPTRAGSVSTEINTPNGFIPVKCAFVGCVDLRHLNLKEWYEHECLKEVEWKTG
jgi:hypothetical protein